MLFPLETSIPATLFILIAPHHGFVLATSHSTIADPIYLMTRAHQGGGSTYINRTLRMRGWLTDFATDALVLGGIHQAKTLSF